MRIDLVENLTVLNTADVEALIAEVKLAYAEYHDRRAAKGGFSTYPSPLTLRLRHGEGKEVARRMRTKGAESFRDKTIFMWPPSRMEPLAQLAGVLPPEFVALLGANIMNCYRTGSIIPRQTGGSLRGPFPWTHVDAYRRTSQIGVVNRENLLKRFSRITVRLDLGIDAVNKQVAAVEELDRLLKHARREVSLDQERIKKSTARVNANTAKIKRYEKRRQNLLSAKAQSDEGS